MLGKKRVDQVLSILLFIHLTPFLQADRKDRGVVHSQVTSSFALAFIHSFTVVKQHTLGKKKKELSHLILLPPALPVHLLHFKRRHIDSVDRPHVDGQFPLQGRDGRVLVEYVGDGDAAGGAEDVPGGFAAELVAG